jgi:hypothetical protein
METGSNTPRDCRIYRHRERGPKRNFTTSRCKHSVQSKLRRGFNGSKFWSASSRDRSIQTHTSMADVGRSFCDDRCHQRGDVPASPLMLKAARR